MNNKSALASLEKIEHYIEELEKKNEELEVELQNATKKTEPTHVPNMEAVAPDAFDRLAVTQVQVWPFKEGPSLGHMKGLAQIVINDQLVIRGLRIMEGVNGLFVGYPMDPFYKGEDFRSLCNPITRALREHIENCVLEKYNAVTEGQGGSHD